MPRRARVNNRVSDAVRGHLKDRLVFEAKRGERPTPNAPGVQPHVRAFAVVAEGRPMSEQDPPRARRLTAGAEPGPPIRRQFVQAPGEAVIRLTRGVHGPNSGEYRQIRPNFPQPVALGGLA